MANMSKQNLLLEIGLEEMPARFVTDSMNQLGEKMEAWLTKQRIQFADIRLLSTPRRLAVLVTDVAEKGQDTLVESKGPAKKIALDETGNWTKAAIGFAKGQGVQLEDLSFKAQKGIEYVFTEKRIKGQDTIDLLPELKEIILSLSFPKNMKWATYDLKYIRPIQWICALFGRDIIPIEITDTQSGRHSFGHRFLGKKIDITEPSNYEQQLLGEYVIADPVARKQSIRSQIEKIATDQHWTISVDEDLLEEVNNLVEYPTAVTGTFDEKYLNIPEEVLITSMKEHQRYFPVKDDKGKLLPCFITFRNGDDANIKHVARGNEKVLRARLADAEFFYEEDKKINLDKAVEKLDKIVFHEQLGTIGDKVRRVKQIATGLTRDTRLDVQDVKHVTRAAELYKFDLVTQMVNEFTELQGVMGEKYARFFGESDEVATAIREHYNPRFAGDTPAQTKVGAVLSLADKLDTIVGFFSIGLVPTGSQDPYGLRRQATGVVQTLLTMPPYVTLETLLVETLQQFEKLGLIKREKQAIMTDLSQFFQLRVKNLLQEENVKHDVIEAVLPQSLGTLPVTFKKAEYLMTHLNDAAFKKVVEALSRVTNIAVKAEHTKLDPNLLIEPAEKELYTSFQNMQEQYEQMLANGNVDDAFAALASLREAIDTFFDKIMVMSDDEQLKQNRLALMKLISDAILAFAHFKAIVFQ